MDLVRQLRDVRFETAVRGYDYAGVDTFLATLRSDVADLQERYEAAQQRIAEFEAKGGTQDGNASEETEGELRRTLVLAQRLADETAADAKASADELVNAANQQAAETTSQAEADATEMREAAEAELVAAREEAETLRQRAGEEAEQSNSESRLRAQALLTDAETAGTERVVEIEGLAQAEVATMREPIREEVEQLEDVRSRLLSDIAELEAHLEAQRVRVRNAVEALRVGMSGSIQDLERVADDDELMAPQPAPEHSNASGADVAAAPDIEIQEAVQAQAAATTPTVEALAPEADRPQHAASDPDTQPLEVIESPEDVLETEVVDGAIAETEIVETISEPEVPEASIPEAVVEPEVSEAVVEPEVSEAVVEPEVSEAVVEPEVSEAVVEPKVPEVESEIPEVELEQPEVASVPDLETGAESMPDVMVEEVDSSMSVGGFAGGAIAGAAVGVAALSDNDGGDAVDLEATQSMATIEDLDQAEIVELDEEPGALFGTDVGADAEAVEAAVDSTTTPADVAAGGEGFVAKFASALDQLPIER